MTQNPYIRWLSTDFDACKPVVPGDELTAIQGQVILRVHQGMGDGPKPTLYMDLEQLQVVDYAAFEGINEAQGKFIAGLHAAEPIRPEEMIFLALRSLFQFTWPLPTSNDDIRFAAAYDYVLHQVLVETALDLAKTFTAPAALLPYWGRLTFLKVMGGLPLENISRFGLDHVVCTLVKKAKFNATTFALEDGPVVGMNYALEPILKQFNRYLMHYHSTKEMAGPNRLSRAWEGIVPIVLHFWSEISAKELLRSSMILYEEGVGTLVHRFTNDQVDFIMMHELGHVALSHPQRLQKERDAGYDVTQLRHEFEFAADAFALGLMRSKLIKHVKAESESPQVEETDSQINRITESLHDYQGALGSVYILFIFMDFIQQAGELLRDRLSSHLHVRSQMDTHPRAQMRLDRLELMNLGEYLYTSPIERYARDFLHAVLDHAIALNDEELLTSVTIAG
jgi:hypothetical protein